MKTLLALLCIPVFAFGIVYTTYGAVQVQSDGTATTPAWTWQADNDSGLYRIGDNNIGLSLNAAKEIDFATTGTTFTHKIIHPAGAAATPSITFSTDPTDTGIYSSGANALDFACNGVKQGGFTTTGLNACALGATTPSTAAVTTLSASGAEQIDVITAGTTTVAGEVAIYFTYVGE